MTRSLRGSRLRRGTEWDQTNPMDGVANLADCMLVLACGLMLSLIVNWNVDLNIPEEQSDSEERDEMIVEIDQNEENQPEDISEYKEYGTVYRDPETGELYVKVDP